MFARKFTQLFCLCLVAPCSLGQLKFYQTPLYCTTIVSNYQTCPPTHCYASNTRSQCCMGVYKSITGSLYQQCMCQSSVACAPLGSSQPVATPAPAPFFYPSPNVCTNNAPLANVCSGADPCFSSVTRSSCCVSVTRTQMPVDSMAIAQCSCNAGVSCGTAPTGR